MAREELLREGFGAFELRAGAARPEALQARGFEGVDDAADERHLGADDGQRDALLLGHVDERREIRDGEGHVTRLRLAGGAGVARRAQDLADLRRLRELPCQRVLAPAVADQQDFHCFAPCLNGGSAACP